MQYICRLTLAFYSVVKSELARDILTNPVLSFVGNAVMTAFFKSADDGAKTLVYAAVLDPKETGKHFSFYQSDDDYRK